MKTTMKGDFMLPDLKPQAWVYEQGDIRIEVALRTDARMGLRGGDRYLLSDSQNVLCGVYVYTFDEVAPMAAEMIRDVAIVLACDAERKRVCDHWADRSWATEFAEPEPKDPIVSMGSAQ